jgi:hypothetical protein
VPSPGWHSFGCDRQGLFYERKIHAECGKHHSWSSTKWEGWMWWRYPGLMDYISYVCMYVCMCICIHIYMYIYTHIYTYVCVRVHEHVCVCVCVHILDVCVYIYIYIYIYMIKCDNSGNYRRMLSIIYTNNSTNFKNKEKASWVPTFSCFPTVDVTGPATLCSLQICLAIMDCIQTVSQNKGSFLP